MLPQLRATKIFFRFLATKKCIVKFPFRDILSLQQLFVTLCPKRELISFQGQILGYRHSLNVIWMRSSSSVLVSLLYQLLYQLLFLIFLSYLSLTMGISFGVIGEMPPWCLIYKCCKIKRVGKEIGDVYLDYSVIKYELEMDICSSKSEYIHDIKLCNCMRFLRLNKVKERAIL